jgi:peptide/nickel transport system ATP-binding protein/oligopeptide transport system ATP-binding protein
MEDLLNITNLKTHFFTKRGIVPAVDGISISIPKSSIVGVVGESGCGKSMTAMSIMQLIQKPGKVVQGTIELNGENMLKYSKEQMFKVRGNKISMIFQEPMTALNPVYTVGKQVTEVITIHHKEISKSDAKQKVIDIFRAVGIPEPEKRFNSYPHQLSGGLRQRVMIGMAMVCNPELMIADEPTTALDVTIEAQILMLMKQLQKERGTSILMITHNLGVVAEICDYVYVMYAGKVMEQANTFELFKNTSHPYTDGLMKSIPKITAEKQRLYNIKGIVPNLMKLPRGCRFCPRCEKAMPKCFETEPPLYKVASDDNNVGDHYVRCFLYENGEVKENE